jgi:hypothetical protein
MSEKRKVENKNKLASRREFLVGSGAVIAAGVLTACSAKTTTLTNTVTQTTTKTAPGTTVTGPTTTATTTATITGQAQTLTTTATTTAPAKTITTTAEKTYDVVSPLGNRVVTMITMAPRLDTLAGKTICIHGSPDFNAPTTATVIQQVLQQQFPTAKVIPYTEMPGWDVYAISAGSQVAAFTQALKDKGANAVIAGNGG